MKTYRQIYEMIEELLPYGDRNNGEAWWKLFEHLDWKYNQGVMTNPNLKEGVDKQ